MMVRLSFFYCERAIFINTDTNPGSIDMATPASIANNVGIINSLLYVMLGTAKAIIDTSIAMFT